MNRERASRLAFTGGLAALGAMAAALLLRDMAAIVRRVPLDPNEGWNAYHAASWLTALYPPPDGLMVNNYPPLSFPLIAMVAGAIGDNIIAGRIVSLLAFLACTVCIGEVLRRMECTPLARAFGALAFACGLLVGSNYVAMDDPQLPGHALQLAGLVLLLRRRPVASALLMAAGVFVKHNLLALPLASAVWLALHHRPAAIRFVLAGLVLGIAGLGLTRLMFGVNLLAAVASPRGYALANFRQVAARFFQWSGPAFAAVAWLGIARRRDPELQFAALYGGAALAIGLLFSGGNGVDVNIFFDAAIALALAMGLLAGRCGAAAGAALAAAIAIPLAFTLMLRFADDNFSYTAAFRAQAPGDIAFLKSGPALCEQLSLCYWAGEKTPIDVFNLGERFAIRPGSDAGLAALLEQRHFRALQFDSLDPFALGPRVRTALDGNYRLDHQDDNGFFFRPR